MKNSIPETKTFDEIRFIWNDGNSSLICRDKTLKEAFRTANEFGYHPFSWYRPSTWDNSCAAFDFAGSYTTVSSKQQKELLK